MKYENIVAKLTKEGYTVEVAEFDYKPCTAVNGVCLVDTTISGEVLPTTATYKQVIQQIQNNMSHIRSGSKNMLSQYKKLGYQEV